MDFRELQYIYTIFLEKTITRASEKLYISQPSLSIALQKIENDLGITIFEKVNRRLVPTEKGLYFINYAKQILTLQENMRTEMKQLISNKKGKIKLGSTPTRSNYIFPAILPNFLKKYPDLEVETIHGSPTELLTMLENNLIDFAFMITDETKNNFNYIPICKEEIILCTSSSLEISHLSEKKEGFLFPWIDINKLEGETFLLASNSWKAGKAGETILAQSHINPKILKLSMVELCIFLTSKNLGISFCPDIMVSHGNFKNKLKYYSIGSNPASLDFYIITRKNFPLTLPHKTLIDITLEKFNQKKIKSF